MSGFYTAETAGLGQLSDLTWAGSGGLEFIAGLIVAGNGLANAALELTGLDSFKAIVVTSSSRPSPPQEIKQGQ